MGPHWLTTPNKETHSYTGFLFVSCLCVLGTLLPCYRVTPFKLFMFLSLGKLIYDENTYVLIVFRVCLLVSSIIIRE